MNTDDFSRPINSDALNESLQKTYDVQINFDKYTREQLENYRNLIRTKVHQVESTANFNELLGNDVYQKDKFVLDVLNTRIKEMLGEGAEVIAEKAKSTAQQKFMGMVHATQKGEKPASKAVAKAAKGMSKKAAKDFAKTKHKGLPAHVDEVSASLVKNHLIKSWDQQDSVDDRLKAGEPVSRKELKRAIRGEKNIDLGVSKLRGTAKVPATKEARVNEISKKVATSFLDKTEPENDFVSGPAGKQGHEKGRKLAFSKLSRHSNAKVPATGVEEGTKMKNASKKSKPDFLDMDKDGNKKEPMKKAVADKKKAVLKNVKESVHDLRHRAYQDFIAEGLAHYLAEDEEGKAKAITAGADMVNDFTSWMQRVGNYQTKSMIELADNIRANFGVQEAETFKASVGQALEGALNSLTAAREEINNAVAVLAGEAPADEPMGQDPGLGQDPSMGGGQALDTARPDAMNLPSMDDEFAASDAAAGGMDTTGRMKRESIERGNRLMKILGS